METEKKIDPVCGMSGHIKAHGHWFCSECCIRKYEKTHRIPKEKDYHVSETSCEVCISKPSKWYKDKFWIIIAVFSLTMVVSYTFPSLNPIFHAIADYLSIIWWAIILGFLVGGIIDYYVPRSYITKFLSARKKRTIIYSVIFGFLASACSHGILAISMELRRKGVSVPSVISFLLASPWANLPITILLFGFFGAKAILLIVCAIGVAIITGFLYQLLDRRGLIEPSGNPHVDKEFSIRKDMRRRLKNYSFTGENLKKSILGVLEGGWSLTKMVLWWLLIGIMMAGFARAFIPTDVFQTYAGPTLLGMLTVLFFATIIEVCSEGSSPLAFEIYRQTGAFGNSFVFLMAGVVTDFTEIGLIWSNIGRKAAIWLPIITVPQVVLIGYLFNLFL